MSDVCSTLSGKIALKHPTLGVLVREDGAIFTRCPCNWRNYKWSYGTHHSDNYCYVGISRRQYSVHRLVAETFIPNPENKTTVDHIDRVRDNNVISNLRWATPKEQNENSIQVLNRIKVKTRHRDNPREYQSQLQKWHNMRGEIRHRCSDGHRRWHKPGECPVCHRHKFILRSLRRIR